MIIILFLYLSFGCHREQSRSVQIVEYINFTTPVWHKHLRFHTLYVQFTVAVLNDMVAEVTRAAVVAKSPFLVSSAHAFPATLWLYCLSQCTEVWAERDAECHGC